MSLKSKQPIKSRLKGKNLHHTHTYTRTHLYAHTDTHIHAYTYTQENLLDVIETTDPPDRKINKATSRLTKNKNKSKAT